MKFKNNSLIEDLNYARLLIMEMQLSSRGP